MCRKPFFETGKVKRSTKRKGYVRKTAEKNQNTACPCREAASEKELMKMNIRPATVSEIPELQLILKQLNTLMAVYQPESCREGVQAAEYLQKIIEEDNSDIVIAEENGSILGLAVVTEGQTPPYAVCVPHRYAYLTDLCVREGNRGQGVGTALLEGVWEWAIN